MNADAIDAGRLTLALNELRLPTIKTIWPDFAARADKEGWPAARFLASLAEHEMGPLNHAEFSRGDARVPGSSCHRRCRSGQLERRCP